MENTVTLPPGHYYLGDPCYIIARQEWTEFLDSWKEEKLFGPLGGRPFAAFHTPRGDGRYAGSDSRKYIVDSGIIAAVPIEYRQFREEAQYLAYTVEFDQEFTCSRDDAGLIRFGHVTIRTGQDEKVSVLIDLPAYLSRELEEFLNKRGVAMNTQDRLIVLNEGHPNRTFLQSSEISRIKDAVNQHLLENRDILPRISGNIEEWSLENRQAFLDLACTAFDWNGQLNIEYDNFSGDEKEWREMAEDFSQQNPGIFAEPWEEATLPDGNPEGD